MKFVTTALLLLINTAAFGNSLELCEKTEKIRSTYITEGKVLSSTIEENEEACIVKENNPKLLSYDETIQDTIYELASSLFKELIIEISPSLYCVDLYILDDQQRLDNLKDLIQNKMCSN